MLQQKQMFVFLLTVYCSITLAQETVGPLGEKFNKKVIINNLSDPWEIVYAQDKHLWITESKGYRVLRIDPSNGKSTVLLDLNDQRNFPGYDKQGDNDKNIWPQGGLMGMALHPDLLKSKPFVYLAYIYKIPENITGKTETPVSVKQNFKCRLVCYEYDAKTLRLINPNIICDTIPASNDHNGGRLLIAPVNGKNFLFYTVGDMGAGKGINGAMKNNAQNIDKYEGKILRFNTEPDSDMNIYDRWIPNDNPFSFGSQNAIWTYGHRNPQGLAYLTIKKNDYIYSSEHGPYSDDEINLIEKGKNYGHPLIIGYNDNNYNGFSAEVSSNSDLPGKWNTSSPLIENENKNAVLIGAAYADPIKSFYPATNTFLDSLFSAFRDGKKDQANWDAVAPGSLEVYNHAVIPGWKNSLLVPSLKKGQVIRLKLNEAGNGISDDTLNYFKSALRYRDLAISPDGKKIYLITDSSSVVNSVIFSEADTQGMRGAVIEFTYLEGGIDLSDLESKSAQVTTQKDAKSLLNQLVKNIRSMDTGTARKVLFSPEMRLAVNLLVKRRLTDEDIQLTRRLSISLINTLKQQ